MTLTKRNVLRFGGRFYDPLGFLSPFTVRVKMLFQELCVEKTHWDSSLTEAHKAKFFKILSETENLNQIRVMRALASSKVNAVRQEIHGLSDASEKAFSAVAYLKTMYDDAEPDVRLIAAKTKVPPPPPPDQTDYSEIRVNGGRTFSLFSEISSKLPALNHYKLVLVRFNDHIGMDKELSALEIIH